MWPPSGSALQSRSVAKIEKEKARNETKDVHGNGSKEKASSPVHVIKIKDFVSLAELIAGYTKPIIKVPQPIVKALDRAIEWPCSYNTWSRKQQSSIESNEAHAYFIGILERTREVLRPSNACI
ncbi:MAG: hypothetical protein Q9224_007336 [Gallowayella concinna]